jgi:hypothetical protein
MIASMLSAYKYLYYRIYAWNLRLWGESDMPHYNALFGVSFLLFLNIMSAFTLVDLLAGKHFVRLTRAVAMSIAGMLICVGYLVLVHKAKYRNLGTQFAGESPDQSRRRLIGIWLYIIITFVSAFWLVSIRNS